MRMHIKISVILPLLLILGYTVYAQELKDPITLKSLECETLMVETSSITEADYSIKEHLQDHIALISDEWLGRITATATPVSKASEGDSSESSNDIYKITYLVPKSFLADTMKILWELNIPEFRSYLYQLYQEDTIFLDIWNNVVGTASDKTYTGNFNAYRIRNWPSWKDPDKPEKPVVPPGPKNPLGLFVVHFDKNSLRYFHGTNKEYLLHSKMRNLSHGCIRNENDNIQKMKEFIIKRVIKSDDLHYWLSSTRSMTYDLKPQDQFPVRIIYRTFTVFRDDYGPYIELYKDIYGYKRASSYGQNNDPSLIILTTKENILREYKIKIRDNKIPEDRLEKIIDYVINNATEYERYYFSDLDERLRED